MADEPKPAPKPEPPPKKEPWHKRFLHALGEAIGQAKFGGGGN